MIKAIIIEDEIHLRNSLRDLLSMYCDNVEVIGMATNCKEGVEMLKNLPTDLVFLDIKLPDGSGFDILETLESSDLKPHNFKTIFTTAYDNYAIQAFKVNAIDYLLKPIDPDDLTTAVSKANTQNDEVTTSLDIEAIKNILNQKGQKKERITISTSDKLYYLATDDIIRCEAQDNYTTFYMHKGDKILVSKTLKEFSDQLEGETFIRVHRSHLINLAYLKTYVKSEGGYLIMTDGSKIPVSARKKEDLIRRISL